MRMGGHQNMPTGSPLGPATYVRILADRPTEQHPELYVRFFWLFQVLDFYFAIPK